MNDQVLQNIFNQAKLAISNDAQTKLYNTLQGRTQAFRKINQRANQRHTMFSGAPAAQQLQYDAATTIPTGVKLVADAAQKMQTNQEQWNKYTEYVKEMNDKAKELESQIKY